MPSLSLSPLSAESLADEPDESQVTHNDASGLFVPIRKTCFSRSAKIRSGVSDPWLCSTRLDISLVNSSWLDILWARAIGGKDQTHDGLAEICARCFERLLSEMRLEWDCSAFLSVCLSTWRVDVDWANEPRASSRTERTSEC